MCAGLDFVIKRAPSKDAVDITVAISIFSDGLAAIARNQLFRAKSKTVIGVPTFTTIFAVLIG
jgi:hypothetical protein